MATIHQVSIASFFALVLVAAGCSDAVEGDARPAGERAEAPAPPGLGTATVEVNGRTFDLVVIGCMEADEDPSGLLEFAGSAVHPDVPRNEIDAALQADAEDDRSDPEASIARNVANMERFLEFGPMFAWQRLIDQGDRVSLMLSSEFGSGEGAWLTAEGEEAAEFIARDGRTFRGTSSVENPATDETGTLTFEARCP